MHPAGPSLPPPSVASLSSLEAMHNMSRERELMAFMLANGARLDPMTLAALAANPLQVDQIICSLFIIHVYFSFRCLVMKISLD